ncbi:DoxX family protein [Halobacteria archaeon AArc-m2/3/4]|uniref:DoxX family protein n=1 Tax=Natronoglomus mannanivorans TaxID=2979990 RepID=A0ABT2Q9M3_9EURY|nr:DoxX family protein [Halobacteria archaeon AArc-m2/3/4]
MSRATRLASGCCTVIVLLVLAVGSVMAHEEYVVDDEHDVGAAEFLTDAVVDPFVVGPLLAGAIVSLAVVVGYLVFRPFPKDFAAFRFAMREYTDYVPWLLRISFGIPLIGAGFGGYFISPAVDVQLRILQIALGFLLLFGLATRLVALVTLVVYLVGVVFEPQLLLQLEFVGGLLAIALVGSGRPSADHVFSRVAGTPGTLYGRIDVVYGRARAFKSWIEPYEQFLPTVTRIGLGVTFVYLGVSQKLLRPGIALSVVDNYDLTAVVPVSPELWVMGAGLTEAALGLALIAGVFTRAGAATAITMFTLTLFALPDDPVLAHVALFGMASVLLITGGGPYSVDNRMTVVEDEVESATPSPA